MRGGEAGTYSALDIAAGRLLRLEFIWIKYEIRSIMPKVKPTTNYEEEIAQRYDEVLSP